RVVANFSSRGPSSCDANQIKPEIVAPGVSVLSSTVGGGYVLMSGTSMAAPYVAGLVALCRQHNPDATVAQIKNALILSATDLGAEGEDNSYGHGLVDAAKMIEMLPRPGEINVVLEQIVTTENDRLDPGETTDLDLTVSNASGNVTTMSGRMVAADPNAITVIGDLSTYDFGFGGTLATSQTAYQISVNPSLTHGSTQKLTVYFELDSGELVDSITIDLAIGLAPSGNLAEHSTGKVNCVISDFGQFGFGPSSIYNLGESGFQIDDDENILYEGGLIVGRSDLQLASSIRDSLGQFRPSDFLPQTELTSHTSASGTAVSFNGRFADSQSAIQIPITVSQESINYTDAENEGLNMLRYWMVNESLTRQTHLSLGLLFDFDLPGLNESISIDSATGMIYQGNNSQYEIGLVNLRGLSTFKGLDNAGSKTGFGNTEQFALISDGVNRLEVSEGGDMMMVIAASPFDLEPGDSIEFALAIVVGDDLAQLYFQAEKARQLYLIPTDIADDNVTVPDLFSLSQNYPNPFNPTTTISFNLSSAEDVRLEIFNTIGRRVRLLHTGRLAAGEHNLEWDGTTDGGQATASGTYFYRLSAGSIQQARKMVLLK
ncbi:MAG: S8 family serine peptidase, partial [candidate division Zixibacteria bacterium]